MSADNWTYCPKCHKNELDTRSKKELAIKQSYGKMSAEEYLQSIKQLEEPVEYEQSLRENYEFGIFEGKFFVSYRASCSVCKYTFTFKEERAAV